MTEDDYNMPRRTRRKLFLLLLMEKKRRGKLPFMAEVLAGKTEAAQTLTVLNSNLCVIDADKFRVLFPGYVGNNSDEFQRGLKGVLFLKSVYQCFFQSRKI